MKVYKCKYLKKILAITVAPIGVFVRPDKMGDKALLNHEAIHWRQQKKLWYIGFYIAYLFEWIFKGYRNISFEIEAYENEKNLEYLK